MPVSILIRSLYVEDVQFNKTPIRLFKSDFLELFTHIHPAVVLIIWVPVAAAFAGYGIVNRPQGVSWIYFPICLAAGLVLWTLTEYMLHRFVFHFRPRNSWQGRITYLFHGIHHAQPMVKSRLVMPPVVSIPLALMFYYFYAYVIGDLLGRSHWIYPLFAAFLAGYICYDMTHYASHHFNLKSGYLKQVRKNHMRHHWQTPDKRFGVTSILWDIIFGTRVKEE
jgi:sterol desaturase/sphingolipid hydroxylase (fatty acid hydroxylase superfamily)